MTIPCNLVQCGHSGYTAHGVQTWRIYEYAVPQTLSLRMDNLSTWKMSQVLLNKRINRDQVEQATVGDFTNKAKDTPEYNKFLQHFMVFVKTKVRKLLNNQKSLCEIAHLKKTEIK